MIPKNQNVADGFKFSNLTSDPVGFPFFSGWNLKDYLIKDWWSGYGWTWLRVQILPKQNHLFYVKKFGNDRPWGNFLCENPTGNHLRNGGQLCFAAMWLARRQRFSTCEGKEREQKKLTWRRRRSYAVQSASQCKHRSARNVTNKRRESNILKTSIKI